MAVKWLCVFIIIVNSIPIAVMLCENAAGCRPFTELGTAEAAVKAKKSMMMQDSHISVA